MSEDTKEIGRDDMSHPMGGIVDIHEFNKCGVSIMNLQYLCSHAIYCLSVFFRLEL